MKLSRSLSWNFRTDVEGAIDGHQIKEGTPPPEVQSQPKHSSPPQEVPVIPLNPLTPEFHPSSQVTVNPPQDNDWIADNTQEYGRTPNVSSASQANKHPLREVMAIHRQQNEQMIATRCSYDVASARGTQVQRRPDRL